MPIRNPNYDQNIKRIYTKMSESLSGQNNNPKLLNSPESINYFTDITLNNSEKKDSLNFSYEHMYASNTENGELIPTNVSNCQTAESEVKFLKEWLLLHLDLIQQQNDEILNKEKAILYLQQENEMLKQRISCLERGSPFQYNKCFNSHSPSHRMNETPTEDMTQDFGSNEDDNKEDIHLFDLECNPDRLSSFSKTPNENERLSKDSASQQPYNNCRLLKQSEVKLEINENSRSEIPSSTISNFNNSNFVSHNSVDVDPMKVLKMNIRRKRLCSNSSALSNNDLTIEEKRSCRKIHRRRKRSVKDDQVLTCDNEYVTQTGEVAFGLINEQEIAMELAAAAATSADLEVPRWRVKVYTSCYTMEGTENLDDEVYNKRHSRLENDERRRKRWDVQRIREQRVIEKLKQRQERTGSGSRNEHLDEQFQSLWPTIDDIRYLEVCEQLPVSAFGCPIPHFIPSEFSLPWLNSTNRTSLKKVTVRKSAVRRKATKR